MEGVALFKLTCFSMKYAMQKHLDLSPLTQPFFRIQFIVSDRISG